MDNLIKIRKSELLEECEQDKEAYNDSLAQQSSSSDSPSDDETDFNCNNNQIITSSNNNEHEGECELEVSHQGIVLYFIAIY